MSLAMYDSPSHTYISPAWSAPSAIGTAGMGFGGQVSGILASVTNPYSNCYRLERK